MSHPELLDKKIVAQMVKKFQVVYETQRSIERSQQHPTE
jgi:hypothetical protein